MLNKVLSRNQIKKRKTGAVFLFHNVGNDNEYTKHLGVTVSVSRFNELIKQIKNNFTVLPFSEFLHKKYDPNACAITFDDGLKSFELNALPILLHLLKVIVSSQLNFALEPSPWSDSFDLLNEPSNQ